MSRTPSFPTRVLVEAPARLHFGVLDLRGHRGRRFGGIGAAIPTPSARIELSPADRLTAEGPDAGRAQAFGARYLEAARIAGGAHIQVHQAIPAHAGLGSGTQLALAVARGLAELYAQPSDPANLSRLVGRGRRSAIGTWTFALGGFVLEGGRQEGREDLAPLISRLPMPADWHCVVVIPNGAAGLSGEAERQAFQTLPEPDEREVERVAHLVLMQLLPALADEDLTGFGSALTEVQRITGGWFAAAQGGRFAAGASRDLVDLMARLGASGVGQSSWGPTVYGITPNLDSARDLAQRIRAQLGADGQVFSTPFARRGALIHASWSGVGRD